MQTGQLCKALCAAQAGMFLRGKVRKSQSGHGLLEPQCFLIAEQGPSGKPFLTNNCLLTVCYSKARKSFVQQPSKGSDVLPL